MTTIFEPIIDDDAVAALRDILAEPSLPVATLSSGPYGERFNALREAHDFVSTHRLAVAGSDAGSTALLAALGDVSPELAQSLRWHAVLISLLGSLDPSVGRNAVLGDVHRGNLLTLGTSVRQWSWYGGVIPAVGAPLQRAEAEFDVIGNPALYDAIVLWETDTAALITLPTYRDRVSWAPAEGGNDADRWTVTLSHTTFHHDDLIPLARLPKIPAV